MTVSPAEPTTPATGNIAPPAAPPAAVAPTPPTPAPTAPAPAASANPWEDPDAAKAEIERLRRENGKERTDAKAKAAADARAELAQTIGKALGIVEDETIDPAELTKSLTESQADANRARVELAVFRNAEASKGDPLALLDSSSFLASLKDIDPTDNAAVSTAITAAVAANPRLAVAPAGPGTPPQPPKPNPAQGSSANGTPGVAQEAAQAAASGDWRESIRLKSQQLAEVSQQGD